MQRIQAIDPSTQTGIKKELFDKVQNNIGTVPNLARVLGNSTAALQGYLSFRGALHESSIGDKLSEMIALTVSNANGSVYCNALHTYMGIHTAGLDDTDIKLARIGKAIDLKLQAALTFTRTILEKGGKVADTDINFIRNAGFNDAAIVEIIACTALNVFTNYLNNAAATVVDFPKTEMDANALIV